MQTLEQKQENKLLSQFSNFSFSNSKLQHLNKYLTEQIGISERGAYLLLNYHKCNTKSQVLELLTSNDMDQKEHIFISSQTKGQICQICEQNQEKHRFVDYIFLENANKKSQNNIDKQEVQIKQESSNSKSFKLSLYQGQNYLCQICYIQYKKQQMANFSETVHNICAECLTSYIQQKITSMQIQSIICPHCGISLQSQVIKNFVNEKTFSIYQQFIRNAQIQKNPNLMWCPNPKCSVVISILKKKKKFSCPKCSMSICSKCHRQSHSGKSCKSVFKNQIKSWQNSNSIQKCKKCCSIVQKVSGCNHMSCSVCGHEWCWLCGSNYSERHFNPMNPFGCAGMQDRHGIGKWRIIMWRITLFLLILIAIPAVLPFALLCAGPFVLIDAFYRKVRYQSRFKQFMMIVSGLIMGLVFNPFIWIGLIIYYSPKVFRMIKDYFRNRRRRLQNSDNRLNQRLINDAMVNEEAIVFESQNVAS